MSAGPTHAPPTHGLRILVVDDHEDTAHALTRLLRNEGHVVTTAHTTAGAMALVVGQRPVELLISDIGLPDEDGCELLRRLRAFYGRRDLPAVALTGHGEEGMVEECRRAGYHHFLLKPFRFEQVLDAVRTVQSTLGRVASASAPAGH
jgi:hypothetical protein